MSLPKNAQALYLAERLKAQRSAYEERNALATTTQVADLATALAGTQQQLAELSQAMLVLAKNAAESKQATLAISEDVAILKKRTEKKPKPISVCKAEIAALWNEMCADAASLNQDANWTTFGRVAMSITSLGLGAPVQIHAAKREIYQHVSVMNTKVSRLEKLIEYMAQVYPQDIDAFLKKQILLIGGAGRYTIQDAMKPTFITGYQRALETQRGL